MYGLLKYVKPMRERGGPPTAGWTPALTMLARLCSAACAGKRRGTLRLYDYPITVVCSGLIL